MTLPPRLLVYFHCHSRTGYAIETLEQRFYAMAERVTGSAERVHFAYPSVARGRPEALPANAHLLEFDPATRNLAHLMDVERYVANHGISLALGFDQQPALRSQRYLRRGGVRRIVSYLGAPMSSLNTGLKLLLKRVEVRLARSSPDHYIFESQAMAQTAVQGRGIPSRRTSVVPLGVDLDKFRPDPADASYVHDALGIPFSRRVFYYSGHFEERKGVRVLVKALRRLVAEESRRDVHLVLLGNRPGEEEPFRQLVAGSPAEQHVTFAGYRSDVPRLLRGCTAGVIPSTGWESFTQSSVEIAASALPLLVSRLEGLNETIVNGETGFSFKPGDSAELADLMKRLVDDPELARRLGAAARTRAEICFSREVQVDALVAIMARLATI